MPTLNICGGIEKFFMNYYRQMPDNIKFDIIVHQADSDNYKKQILDRKDKLYVLPTFSIKNYKKIYKEAEEIIGDNNYDVIHCQMANAGFIYLKLAKKYKIPKRILHSHQCKYADKETHALRNIPLIWLAKKYANTYAACGHEAGKFMFGNRQFVVFNNAIDQKEYIRNNDERKSIREKHGIETDCLLLGSVGRLVPQKNHEFSIRLVKTIDNCKLMIIGDGELKNELEQAAANLNIKNKVIFVESTDKISSYYSAMDALVMPSTYEGLPFVGVEAQFAGLPCYFSDNITKELQISNNAHFLSTRGNNSITEWEEVIKKTYRKGNNLQKTSTQFDIKSQANKLKNYYEKSIKHEHEEEK